MSGLVPLPFTNLPYYDGAWRIVVPEQATVTFTIKANVGYMVMGIKPNDRRSVGVAYELDSFISADVTSLAVKRYADEDDNAGTVLQSLPTDLAEIVMVWGPTGLAMTVNGGAPIQMNSDVLPDGPVDFVIRVQGNTAATVFDYIEMSVSTPTKALFWTTFRGSHEIP